jgi:hypothetical protein
MLKMRFFEKSFPKTSAVYWISNFSLSTGFCILCAGILFFFFVLYTSVLYDARCHVCLALLCFFVALVVNLIAALSKSPRRAAARGGRLVYSLTNSLTDWCT